MEAFGLGALLLRGTGRSRIIDDPGLLEEREESRSGLAGGVGRDVDRIEPDQGVADDDRARPRTPEPSRVEDRGRAADRCPERIGLRSGEVGRDPAVRRPAGPGEQRSGSKPGETGGTTMIVP
ncbi:hypothetical protein, partial [Curtobacterium sp. B8]|uniref:hypothetical protein n=1 Tax=Curtobacterium sp. B8 TaxID=95611 RepID=UPI001C9DD05A